MSLSELSVSQAGSELGWALAALSVSPAALGGAWVRAHHSPARDQCLAILKALGNTGVRIPSHVDDERLLGGLDVSATLAQGRPVWQAGLLAQAAGGLAVLPMAERLNIGLVARIIQAQDRSLLSEEASFGLLALDESLEDETGIVPSLAERLGLWLDLRELTLRDPIATEFDPDDVAYARTHWSEVTLSEEQIQVLCQTALVLGVDSLRAPLMAARLARILAALQRRRVVEPQDVSRAARWVLAPRATVLPAQEAEPQTPDTPESPEPPEADQTDTPPADDHPPSQQASPPPEEMPPLEEVVLQAALAALPDQLLDRLKLNSQAVRGPGSQGQQGALRHSRHRGRPLAPRPGKPHQGARLHVLATLRSAIPRQALRAPPQYGARLAIRVEDFHCQRFAQHTSTCLIFAVDASGSAAVQRLAEAKGAVELLLQQSYARRDQVCVLSFRAGQAQVLLPPTRSLVRAKRALSGLPAGGGTPLASALRLALEVAQQQVRAGVTPVLVMLSDGRANVNLAGVGGRQEAQQDARTLAQAWGQHRLTALWLDTSLQPDPLAQEWARLMTARYLPMPYAPSARMADAMRLVLNDTAS
ncbi:MAG: magnesium chelatase subunit D [Limnohabitans sp.]